MQRLLPAAHRAADEAHERVVGPRTQAVRDLHGVDRRHGRRIVAREEACRGQHAGKPRLVLLGGDDLQHERERMADQQIGIACRLTQLLMGFAQVRHDQIPDQSLGAEHGVCDAARQLLRRAQFRQTRRDGCKLQACRFHIRPVVAAGCDARLVAARAQRPPHGDIRMQISE